ncbi:hypothetical protein EUGRSUZ_H01341 [Eucalyptus grandis]|uniref:Uncharacterized protein n=2 Tax=Eucalyptus grandis TaxID=71139 RepID=A0ACC3JPU9_EUCGR|nr:hypothetical protein EUGRSUZ_H01341 [Eucalyptus grandis]
MAKKIVIKVTIGCGKDKKDIMKSVAKLKGINEMKIDIEKGTLTIIGDVDPVCVIKALRKKCGICAEIDSLSLTYRCGMTGFVHFFYRCRAYQMFAGISRLLP